MPTTETVYLPTRCRNEAGFVPGNVTREGGHLIPCVVTRHSAAETSAARRRGEAWAMRSPLIMRGLLVGSKATATGDSDRQRGYRAACAATRRAVDDDKLAALAGDPPNDASEIDPDDVDGYSKISSDDDEIAAGAAAARLALGKK